MEEEIALVDARWDDLNKNLPEKVDKLKNLQNQLEKYHLNLSPVTEQLADIQNKADVQMTPVADLDKVKDYQQELQDLMDDFEKLDPSLAETIESGQDILDGNPELDTVPVQKENEELQDKATNLKAQLAEKLAKAADLANDLEKYLEKEKELAKGIDDVNDELEKNKPNKMDVDLVREQLEKTKVRYDDDCYQSVMIDFY